MPPNRILAGVLTVLLPLCVVVCAQQPRLLLTPQRLKRLHRDRDRQTDRWNSFEKRVQTVVDSPERGFELALYSVATGDVPSARAAVDWALGHPCEVRQVSLVLDWTGAAATDAERASLVHHGCPASADPYVEARDRLFLHVIGGGPAAPLPVNTLSAVPAPPSLYALAEYLDVYRSTQGEDLRSNDAVFFRFLPALYLLGFHPADLEKPSWQAHVTALALVALDPNLQESQFLQGWAMEDRFELHEGPGIGYELLWANSYLPGIGYQNRQTWIYLPGHLIARTDWKPDACWIEITASGIQQDGCAGRPEQFGSLHLLALESACTKVVPEPAQSIVLQAPGLGKVKYSSDGQQIAVPTDAARLWEVPYGVSGKICWSAER